MSKFSQGAIASFHFAREEANLLHTACLGTEHLLLGIVRESEEQVADLFQRVDVDLARARAALRSLIGRGEESFSREQMVCLTPDVRRIWHSAVDEARKMRQEVEVKHILLALTLQPENKASRVLKELNVDLAEFRIQVLQTFLPIDGVVPNLLPEESEPAQRFDKFTQRARLVVMRSEEEALLFHHSYIDLEHLFLSLVCSGEGVALQVLAMSGVDVDVLEQTFVRQLCSQKQTASGLMPRAKRVVELAVDEAFSFRHRYLGTEHLLLGMLRESEGPKENMLTRLGLKRRDETRAENLFVSAGLNVEDLRKRTLLVLAGGATDDPRQG